MLKVAHKSLCKWNGRNLLIISFFWPSIIGSRRSEAECWPHIEWCRQSELTDMGWEWAPHDPVMAPSWTPSRPRRDPHHGPVVTPSRHRCGSAMAPPWHCRDPVMAPSWAPSWTPSWPHHDPIKAPSWPHHDPIMAPSWPCHDPVVTQSWPHREHHHGPIVDPVVTHQGTVVAPSLPHGPVVTLSWPCRDPVMAPSWPRRGPARLADIMDAAHTNQRRRHRRRRRRRDAAEYCRLAATHAVVSIPAVADSTQDVPHSWRWSHSSSYRRLNASHPASLSLVPDGSVWLGGEHQRQQRLYGPHIQIAY